MNIKPVDLHSNSLGTNQTHFLQFSLPLVTNSDPVPIRAIRRRIQSIVEDTSYSSTSNIEYEATSRQHKDNRQRNNSFRNCLDQTLREHQERENGTRQHDNTQRKTKRIAKEARLQKERLIQERNALQQECEQDAEDAHREREILNCHLAAVQQQQQRGHQQAEERNCFEQERLSQEREAILRERQQADQAAAALKALLQESQEV